MNASKLSSLVILAATVGMTGCGQGFSATSTSAGVSNSAASVGNGGTTDQQAAFKALQVDGTVTGLFGDGSAQVIEIDKVNMQLVARIPIPLGAITGIGIAPVAIKEIPGATIGVESTSTGSSALTLRIPLAAYIKGISLGNAAKLPNGDALPAIPGGELPALALNLTKVGNGITLYLDKAVVGIFVDIKSSYMGAIPLSLTIPLTNSSKTRTWGYISNILPKTGYDGGIFMSLAMPDDIARAIDNVL